MEKTPQIFYDLKAFIGHFDSSLTTITRQTLDQLTPQTTVIERTESFSEALELLKEYSSISYRETDGNGIVVEAFGIEEMDYRNGEYVSAGGCAFAPFDESSIVREENEQ